MYWKRATYFWAFVASAFVGYFGLVNATSYRATDKYQHVEVYFVICLGFILSLAWVLTNVGSKQWQRHWETLVDLLEDQFTGSKPRRDAEEERKLIDVIEQIGPPREPSVRVYRIDADGKQTRMGVMSLEYCDEEAVREQFGTGTFLLRSVRSNGTYGPSTVVRLAPSLRKSW